MENNMTNVSMKLNDNFIGSIKSIINAGRRSAYNAVNEVIVQTYWQIGKRIVEEEQHGMGRAEYGKFLIETLSQELTKEYGKGFSVRSLQYYRKFYLSFPDITILQACVRNLTWSHFRMLLRVEDETARLWYMNETMKSGWSYRMLDRNIATQYYYRLLQTPNKEAVIAEMQDKTRGLGSEFEVLKSPVVAEFLGFAVNTDFTENDLEKAILSHIRDFLMELGRGFAFVARQQHIVTDTEDYYIDLVFYNTELHCYVLIDLKMGKITHQDVGQMDMYIRMYDELKRGDGDNPTLGIILCAETSEDIARYSVLHDSKQLYMSKYLTYLPSKEELRREIEWEKEIFKLQWEN